MKCHDDALHSLNVIFREKGRTDGRTDRRTDEVTDIWTSRLLYATLRGHKNMVMFCLAFETLQVVGDI